jgi:hypothetical protein
MEGSSTGLKWGSVGGHKTVAAGAIYTVEGAQGVELLPMDTLLMTWQLCWVFHAHWGVQGGAGVLLDRR